MSMSDVMPCRYSFGAQKRYFSPSCISRLLTTVELIRPKSAAPSDREGAENCGVLRKLNASYRN